MPRTFEQYCTAIEPTPPLPAWTSTCLPRAPSTPPNASTTGARACSTVSDTSGSAAAWSSGMDAGARATSFSSAATSSSHAPHFWPRIWSIANTLSPALNFEPSGAATTTPETSVPGTFGSGMISRGIGFSRSLTSTGFTPAPTTQMSTWPATQTGRGTRLTSSCDASPCSPYAQACIFSLGCSVALGK